MNKSRSTKEWMKFIAGLGLLLGLAFCLGSGLTPPGPLGEVIRHNQARGIDATPLFYTDVENMQQLEQAVAEMRNAAAK